MTKLPQPLAATTKAFLADAGPRLADLCTGCGACFRACPMTAHVATLAGAESAAVTLGLKALANGLTGPPETVAWVGVCAKSGLCVAACPEREKGLDAMLLVRIARQRAINDTHQISPKADTHGFPRVKTFARLQLTDEEIERWL
ncbi:MAG: 4Fe-4S binding protein [Hyphomicrobiaceae bacterium]|nr:4Fe-4S binding protein [Hyphomicrobiaceae bacterium]